MTASIPLGLLLTPGSAEAQHPGELRLRVVDAVTGAGVPGVHVLVQEQGRTAVSDGDGGVYIRGLEAGAPSILLSRLGYHSVQRVVEVRDGRITRLRIRLHPAVLPGDSLRVRTVRGEGRTVDRSEIRRSGARTLADVLSGPGAVTVVRRGPGGAAEPQLRGGGSDQLLVMVDGVVLNDPLTGTVDLSVVPAAAVERVRVLPGARVARYGAGALAGVIMVETRGPDPGFESSGHVGSLGARGGELSLPVPLPIPGPSASVGLSARWLDGDFRYRRDSSLGGGVRERRNADLRQLGVRATLEGRRGPGGWRVALSAEEVDRGIPGKSFAPSDSARQRESGLTATARWTHRLQDLSTTLQLHHRLRRARFRDPAPPLGPPFDHLTDLTETGVLWRTEASPAGRTDVLARPAVGLEASVDRRRLRSDVLEDSGARTTLDAAVATYGSAALPRLPATPVVGAAVRGHRDGLSDSWLGAHEVSLELSLGPGRIRAAHRSSFSPPTAGDLFFRQGVGIRANPHLRPERVRSETELGGSLRLGRGAVSAEFSGELFTGDLDDMIVWAPDFRFVWSPRNVDVRRRGAEVRGELRHDGWGLSLGGHAARVHTTYRSGGGTPGSQVIYRPRDTGGATIALTASRWTAELRARYTGARHPVPAPVNVLEPFWAFDLSFTGQVELAGWQLQPGLHVERLLDQRSPFIHAFPEPGRTLSLELRARSRP